MANSKPQTKTISREKKPVAASKAAKTRKMSANTMIPGENEIRIKAMEIYTERISRGEHGTAEEDWLRAENLLRG